MAEIAAVSPATVERKRKNLATTNDGSAYNKRPRPDFLYTREPLTDIAHLGHPELEEEDVHVKGPERKTTHSRSTIFDLRDRTTNVNRGKVDAGSGQKFSLPIPEGEGSASDEDTDAVWKYMRAVRSEAARLPSVKRAPNATRVEDQGDEYTIDINDEGYFEDGAFVAGKRKQWQPDRLEGETDEDYLEDKSEEEETSISPQEAYYEDLKVRFLQHRALLSTTPPLPRISALKASQPIWIPDQGQSLQCQAIVEENDPVPAQVASMNIETIFRLLNIVARSLVPGGNITKRQSLWIWSLLARLPDAGVMDNWNVHRWRQNIGKRAVILRAVYDERCHQLARRYQLLDENIAWDDANFSNSAEVDQVSERTTVSGDAIKEDSCGTEMVPKDAVDEDEEQAMDLESSDEEGEIDELAEAKQELLQALSASEEATQSLQMESESLGKQDTDSELKGMSSTSKKSAPAEDEEPFPNLNTRVTLDMMITVIGDLYGQRDLLECRADWDEDEESCV